MGAEHFLTGARDFNNPYAQQIWRQGAYTPEQYLFGFGMGFGIGGAMGGGAHFLRGGRRQLGAGACRTRPSACRLRNPGAMGARPSSPF
jgi:hypothetical protein